MGSGLAAESFGSGWGVELSVRLRSLRICSALSVRCGGGSIFIIDGLLSRVMLEVVVLDGLLVAGAEGAVGPSV